MYASSIIKILLNFLNLNPNFNFNIQLSTLKFCLFLKTSNVIFFQNRLRWNSSSKMLSTMVHHFDANDYVSADWKPEPTVSSFIFSF